MKLHKTKQLSSVYKREEDFSADLAEHISFLGVGDYEDVECESRVGTKRADIVATGADGILVVENQFGKADWDHWGRLEAYARLKEAQVAALVAEDFEELMIVTANLRNEDSWIDWYLIKALVNEHDEFSFEHVARPAIDIQTEKNPGEYSEFWGPIRKEGLFAGKPVPLRDEGWIAKWIKGVAVVLQLRDHSCSAVLGFQGDGKVDKRDKVLELFPKEEHEYEIKENEKSTNVIFPVLSKGKQDVDDWDEIREKLTSMGESIYTTIKKADL